MTAPRMRISLSQQRDAIKGTIELPADGVFVLEGLAMVVEQFAKQHGVSVDEAVRDLHSVAAGRVV